VFSGARGNGKSTGAIKLGLRCDNPFLMGRDVLFSRDDVIKNFKKKEKGIIIADEMIMVGYRREFYNKTQQEFIKLLNTQRDKGNVFIACVPNFANLDKDILGLTFLHIHIAKRGIGYLFCPPPSSIFSNDRWKIDECRKLEERHLMRKIAGGVPAWKLPNFVGTLRFPKLTERQETAYQKIKDEKRNQFFEEGNEIEHQQANSMDRCKECMSKATWKRAKLLWECRNCPNSWKDPKYSVTTEKDIETIPLTYTRNTSKKSSLGVTIE
jgi:ribosomal protein L37AE/L43A